MVSSQESTALIVMNYNTVKEDLGILIKLMHIARNLLVNAEPEVPQDLCAAVHFDQMVYQTVILCVNVASKGYDGEVLDESQRLKLADISELCMPSLVPPSSISTLLFPSTNARTDKKLLVTALQQAHNWTAKHDRNKMSFWFDVLFDEEDAAFSGPDEGVADDSQFRPDMVKQQVQHWLDRNSRMCETARSLLRSYSQNQADKPPGSLAPIRPLAWNWLWDDTGPPKDELETEPEPGQRTEPVWNPNEGDRFEQDRAYMRVSREVDTWWLRARDPNYEEWVVGMPSVDFAQSRTEHCKNNLVHRYAHYYRDDRSPPVDAAEMDLVEQEQCRCPECDESFHEDDQRPCERQGDDEELDEDEAVFETDNECDHSHCHPHSHLRPHHHHHHRGHDSHGYPHEYVEDVMDDEAELEGDDDDDNESYGDGPLMGLLTEVPNILDPKQIEALHMIIKSCIHDSAGSGLTHAGENLQKTRCRMFIALDCGKSLLRELLVFIAVWDKDEQSLIFQVTTQIVEAIHQDALIPYAWNSLRIPKDIIAPAQTVLLRLLNYMLRARAHSPATQEAKDVTRDLKLVHFLFSFFRSRIVPECAALMHLQAQIREKNCDPAEFPVDCWDMERAKDGLAQYLDFLTTAAEVYELRAKLIEWEAVYDFITILSSLEAAVQKKALVELPKRSPPEKKANPMVERPYSVGNDGLSPSPPPPPLQEPAHKFPWSGIKGQLFTLIATLLQPPPGQSSPGNPQVQTQMVKYNGIVPLLNCCAYDDHNPYAKERVTICLKWLLDGCEAANNFFRDLVSMAPQSNLRPPAGGTTTSTVKVDGVQGEVKVQVQSSTAPRAATSSSDGEDSSGLAESAADLSLADVSG